MKQAKVYAWKGTDNAKKLYQLLQTMCGNDYTQWHKHADYGTALQMAHNKIFGFSDVVVDITRKGLDVQVCFLTGTNNKPHWAVKRLPQYVSAVLAAYDAEVIDRAKRDRLIEGMMKAAVIAEEKASQK